MLRGGSWSNNRDNAHAANRKRNSPNNRKISFADLDAAFRGWIAHVAHADSRGLREHVLQTLVMRPAEQRLAVAEREPAALIPSFPAARHP